MSNFGRLVVSFFLWLVRHPKRKPHHPEWETVPYDFNVDWSRRHDRKVKKVSNDVGLESTRQSDVSQEELPRL